MTDIVPGPSPVPTSANVSTISQSSIDRKPAPVPVTTPQVPQPATPISPAAIDRQPDPVQIVPSGTVSTVRPTVSANIVPVVNPPANVIPAPPPPPIGVVVYEEGSLLTSAVRSFNFVGNGVVATANTQTNAVTVTVNQSGPSSTYGNANVISLLAAYGSNTISTTGNITAGNIIAGNLFGNIQGLYGNANVVSLLSEYGSNSISTAGNITAGNLLGNIQGLNGNISGLTTVNLDVVNISARDSSGVNIGAGGYNNLVVLEDEVLIQNVPLTTTGNISANYFVGNGSQLTGISAGANLGNLAIDNYNIYNAVGQGVIISNFSFVDEAETAYVQIPAGNSTNDLSVVQTQGNVRLVANAAVWNFDTLGNLTIPNGGYINFVNTGGISQALNEDLKFTVSDDEEDGWAIESTVNDGAGNDFTRMQVRYDGVRINTDIPTNSYYWNFRDTGEFEVPGPIRGPVGGNLVIDCGDASGSDTFIDIQTRSHVGDALISNIRIANPNVTISTSSGAKNWTFGGTGNLTLPASGNIVGVTANNSGHINWIGNSSGDGYGYTTMNLVPDDTVNDGYIILDPTAPNHIHIRAGGTQDNSSAQLFLGGENSYFSVGSGQNPQLLVQSNGNTWVFNTDGNLQVPGNINGDNNAPLVIDGASSGEGFIRLPNSSFGGEQIVIVNQFSLGNGIRLQTNGGNLFFDNNGVLNLTGDLTTTGNVSAQSATFSGNINGSAGLDIDGNATIGGNLFVTGNINFTGNVTQISGNSGVFFGNASTGVGALYAGKTGYTPVANTILQVTGDLNDYIQVNLQNTNHGNTGSMELAITADDGDDLNNYIDLGIAGSTWDGTQTNSLGTAVQRRDGYLYVQGGAAGGNLVLGTTTAGYAIKFNAGGPGSSNTVATISNTGISTTGSITATNIGNVAALNLNGNASQVLYGNGVFAAVAGGSSYGDSNVVSLMSAFGSNTITTTGNITGGNLRATGNLAFTSSNASGIVFNNGAYISGNGAPVGREGSIVLQPYTGNGSVFPGVVIGGAGRLCAPSGSVHQVFNTSDVSFQVVTKVITGTNSTSISSGALQISGGAGFTGNIYVGGVGNIAGNVTVSGTGGVSQPNAPAFRVYGTSSNTIAANTTITSTQGTTIDYNTGNSYNNTTGVFTAPIAGIYQCWATLRVGTNNGMNQAAIQKNSSLVGANVVAFWETDTNAGTAVHFPMSGCVKLAVNDTIRLQVLTGNVIFDSNDSWGVTFLG